MMWGSALEFAGSAVFMNAPSFRDGFTSGNEASRDGIVGLLDWICSWLDPLNHPTTYVSWMSRVRAFPGIRHLSAYLAC